MWTNESVSAEALVARRAWERGQREHRAAVALKQASIRASLAGCRYRASLAALALVRRIDPMIDQHLAAYEAEEDL